MNTVKVNTPNKTNTYKHIISTLGTVSRQLLWLRREDPNLGEKLNTVETSLNSGE